MVLKVFNIFRKIETEFSRWFADFANSMQGIPAGAIGVIYVESSLDPGRYIFSTFFGENARRLGLLALLRYEKWKI